MKDKRTIIRINALAYHFAHHSRNIDTLADYFNVTPAAIRKWTKTADWGEALDAIKYTGSRNFETQPKRDAQRENPKLFEQVKTAYLELKASDETPAKIARLVEKKTGVPARKIRDWAKRYRWRESLDRKCEKL